MSQSNLHKDDYLLIKENQLHKRTNYSLMQEYSCSSIWMGKPSFILRAYHSELDRYLLGLHIPSKFNNLYKILTCGDVKSNQDVKLGLQIPSKTQDLYKIDMKISLRSPEFNYLKDCGHVKLILHKNAVTKVKLR